MDWLLKTADRLESAYLAALRIGVLVLATLALIVAVFIAGDGLRSLLTSTDVKPKKVEVAPSELVAAIDRRAQVARGQEAPALGVDAATKTAHAAFLAGPFRPLYRLYAANARRFNKAEDKLLTVAEFAERLGYGLDNFDSGADATVLLFANDEEYADQLVAAVTAAAARPQLVRELQRYKTAQKTARTCTTVYERRRGWDSSSMACNGWYYTPIGCPVIREVPVQKCEAAYPSDITSPVVAFANLDQGFREIWKSKSSAARAAAAATAAERANLQATGLPKLTRASALLGLFLGIMFLFLVIAVERHLRRLKDLTAAPAAVETPKPVAKGRAASDWGGFVMMPDSRTLWRILLILGAISLPWGGATLAQDRGRVVEVLPKAPPARRPVRPETAPPSVPVEPRPENDPVEVLSPAARYAAALTGIDSCGQFVGRFRTILIANNLFSGFSSAVRSSKDQFETEAQYRARTLQIFERETSSRIGGAKWLVLAVGVNFDYNAEGQFFHFNNDFIVSTIAKSFRTVFESNSGVIDPYSYRSAPSPGNIHIAYAPDEARRIHQQFILVTAIDTTTKFIDQDSSTHRAKITLGQGCTFLINGDQVLGSWPNGAAVNLNSRYSAAPVRAPAPASAAKPERDPNAIWAVQVGSFRERSEANAWLKQVGKRFNQHFHQAEGQIMSASGWYRVRYNGMTQAAAMKACDALKATRLACMVIRGN